MDYHEALEYLYNNLPMFQRQGKSAVKKDLTNTIKFCNQLGNPHQKFKSVHIAGTNGKGSTAHSLAAVLQLAGYKTGLYTSPHLKSFTERIKINGEEIKEEEVAGFVSEHKDYINNLKPSFFEMTVAMAFDYFAREEVDIAVIEVGLGGRLDSTNVITPLVSVITNIGLDHTDFLGDNLTQIAGEKAGIIKPGIPVVISEYQVEIVKVFKSKSRESNAPIHFADQDYQVSRNNDGSYRVHLQNGETLFASLITDLKGVYHLKNLPGIIKAVHLLNEMNFEISENALAEGISKAARITSFKGRWQLLQDNPLMVCDIAHNETGVRPIVEYIDKLGYARIHIIWGMVKDKNIEAILKLLPTTARYYFCEARIPRALPAADLAKQAKAYGLSGEIYNNVNKAIIQALKIADKDDLIFIGGSAFVVAEIEGL